jgi:hypothetical protein
LTNRGETKAVYRLGIQYQDFGRSSTQLTWNIGMVVSCQKMESVNIIESNSCLLPQRRWQGNLTADASETERHKIFKKITQII